MQDLIKLIESQMPSLSKGQKRIAGFIRDRYDRAAYMTAAKLAEEVGCEYDR